MNKKFAICEVDAITGKHITILNHDEYCTAMCNVNVLHESDSFNDLLHIYVSIYKNLDVTDKWLKENGYTHSIKSAFVGEVNHYCKQYDGGRIEITLSDDKPGYQVELTARTIGFMQFYNCKNTLTIDKLNTLINIFNE